MFDTADFDIALRDITLHNEMVFPLSFTSAYAPAPLCVRPRQCAVHAMNALNAMNTMNTMNVIRIRVLITDDHAQFRRALRCFLELDPAIEIIGEASSGQQACSMAQEGRAQVVCVDWRMAGMNGIDTIRRLLAVMPQIKIIALSAGFEEGVEAAMLAAGALCYINKERVSEQLLPAIHALFAQPQATGTGS